MRGIEGGETEKTASNPRMLRVLEEESYAEITARIEVRGRGSDLYN